MEGFIYKLYEFMQNNSTQFWTLVSVMLGGMVTYVSTSMTEKRKNKWQFQREKMEEILLPYCTCIEQTIAVVKKMHNRADIHSEADFQQWRYDLSLPTNYLSASKRVYLRTFSRKLLQKFNDQLSNFGQVLEKETALCLNQYKSYISKCIGDFDESSIEIMYSMEKDALTKLKIAIINKSDISLINQFKSYNFIYNDDPDNDNEISIDIDDDYRNTWSKISYGHISYEDILDDNEKTACELLEYIDENVLNEKEILSQIIEKTNSSHLLKNIADTLEEIQRKLLKEIDKIASY